MGQIITIAREMGSGGRTIGKMLSEKLGVKFYDKALGAEVAYVAGSFFHPDGSGLNTMRMNFSFMSPQKIETGVKILAGLLAEEINEMSK